MERKYLIELLEYHIYPQGGFGNNFSYTNKEGKVIFVNRKEVQKSFEDLMKDINN